MIARVVGLPPSRENGRRGRPRGSKGAAFTEAAAAMAFSRAGGASWNSRGRIQVIAGSNVVRLDLRFVSVEREVPRVAQRVARRAVHRVEDHADDLGLVVVYSHCFQQSFGHGLLGLDHRCALRRLLGPRAADGVGLFWRAGTL